MLQIKELRIKKGLTQQQVADALHISRQVYGFYENGKREPNIETLKRIASFFGVSVDYLLGTDSSVSSSLQKKISNADKETLQELEAYLDYITYKNNKESTEKVTRHNSTTISEQGKNMVS